MPIAISWQGATLGANTFTGAQVAPSLALGGATISTYALAITGTVNVSSNIFTGGYMDATAGFNVGSSGYIGWSSRVYMRASSDGVFKLGNNAETDFNRLQFGGTGATYPSIKRNATALNFRLADDSADAPITAAAATFSGALTVPGVTTAALTSTGTFTSGAGAQVGTLTNAPAAGNPTTWVKIVDNGVTRYIPAW